MDIFIYNFTKSSINLYVFYIYYKINSVLKFVLSQLLIV